MRARPLPLRLVHYSLQTPALVVFDCNDHRRPTKTASHLIRVPKGVDRTDMVQVCLTELVRKLTTVPRLRGQRLQRSQ